MRLGVLAKKYFLPLTIACTATAFIHVLWYVLSRGLNSTEHQHKLGTINRAGRQEESIVSTLQQPIDGLDSGVTSNPQLLDKCNAYKEFRSLNFFQPALRHQLCRNVDAYELLTDGYPLCVLPNPFNKDIMKIVKDNSETMEYKSTQSAIIKLFVFKGNEATSLMFKRDGRYFEAGMIHWLTRFTLKFMPDVTFIDIGCNLGAYTMEAASLGLPVVSLEANIRNILRVRLSLEAAKLNVDLVWNFMSQDRELKYMNFPDSCSTSFSSGKIKMAIKDTVPIMPVEADKLRSLIKTKNVIIKVDIEGGETDFLVTSSRLFTDFNVVAVQMEWNKGFVSPKETANMIKIVMDRGYKMWRVPGFIPIVDVSSVDWSGSGDILYVHPKFVHMM